MSAQIRYNPAMTTTLYPECNGPFVVWSHDQSGYLQPHNVDSFNAAVELYLSDTLRFVAIMEVVPITISDARQKAREHVVGTNGRMVTVAIDEKGDVVHAALNIFKRRAEIEQKVLTWVLSGLLVKQMKLTEMPDYYPKERIEFINE